MIDVTKFTTAERLDKLRTILNALASGDWSEANNHDGLRAMSLSQSHQYIASLLPTTAELWPDSPTIAKVREWCERALRDHGGVSWADLRRLVLPEEYTCSQHDQDMKFILALLDLRCPPADPAATAKLEAELAEAREQLGAYEACTGDSDCTCYAHLKDRHNGLRLRLESMTQQRDELKIQREAMKRERDQQRYETSKAQDDISALSHKLHNMTQQHDSQLNRAEGLAIEVERLSKASVAISDELAEARADAAASGQLWSEARAEIERLSRELADNQRRIESHRKEYNELFDAILVDSAFCTHADAVSAAEGLKDDRESLCRLRKELSEIIEPGHHLMWCEIVEKTRTARAKLAAYESSDRLRLSSAVAAIEAKTGKAIKVWITDFEDGQWTRASLDNVTFKPIAEVIAALEAKLSSFNAPASPWLDAPNSEGVWQCDICGDVARYRVFSIGSRLAYVSDTSGGTVHWADNARGKWQKVEVKS